MGGSTIVQPPPAPVAVDPGQSSIDFIEAMSNPALQEKIYQAEATYRPAYTQLALADSYNQLFGFGEGYAGRPGGGYSGGGQGTGGSGVTDDQQAIIQGEIDRLQGLLENPDLSEDRRAQYEQRLGSYQASLDSLSQYGTGGQGSYSGEVTGAGTPGALDLLGMATPIIGQIQADALTQQRTADIADVEALGGRATEALRASDPAMQALIGQQTAASDAAYGRTPTDTQAQQGDIASRKGDILGLAEGMMQGLTAQQERQAEQQAREAAGSRGVEMGNAAIASEILNREDFLRQNRAEAQSLRGEAFNMDAFEQVLRGEEEQYRQNAFMEGQGAGTNLFNMLKSTSADPFQAILGRPGTAYGGATGQQAFGAGFNQANMGPQLFDPNAGINLALQNQANLGNYQASVYGSQAAAQGNMAGGIFSGLGGLAQGIGSAGGMAAFFCWVAREVYGTDNDRWTLFRYWLLSKAPSWFANLYMKHGEQFAEWIKNKPAIKYFIRKWMDGRISTLEREFSYGKIWTGN